MVQPDHSFFDRQTARNGQTVALLNAYVPFTEEKWHNMPCFKI